MVENKEAFQQFLTDFVQSVDDEEPFPFKIVPTRVSRHDLEGECIDWVLQYLGQNQCPSSLALRLARAVTSGCQTSSVIKDLQDAEGGQTMDAHRLAGHVHQTLMEICRSWSRSIPEPATPSPRVYTVSAHAVRNTRRKMEDRHTVIQDLNTLYGLDAEVPQSFYGVFDGHGGVEAAVYSAAHVHQNLARNDLLLSDPAAAMLDAYRQTDEHFIEKAKKEGWKCGSTGVSLLIRGEKLVVSWLGDSQALLVRAGNPVDVMSPHKPEREDERKRIEALGGCVVWFGAWRVNGSLSVSRAIGDPDHKPFVSGQADVTTVDRDGSEEYVILACDGLWDVLSPLDVAHLVYEHVTENDYSSVAARLVQMAKEQGSNDNISVVVVFLKDGLVKPPHYDSDESESETTPKHLVDNDSVERETHETSETNETSPTQQCHNEMSTAAHCATASGDGDSAHGASLDGADTSESR